MKRLITIILLALALCSCQAVSSQEALRATYVPYPTDVPATPGPSPTEQPNAYPAPDPYPAPAQPSAPARRRQHATEVPSGLTCEHC
jgi:hypothetical protein